MNLEPRLIVNRFRKGWAVWLWLGKIRHPSFLEWGFTHGLDGTSHSFWLGFIQFWWSTRKRETGKAE